MAYLELVAACLVVHLYSIVEDEDSYFALADGPLVVAIGVYIAAVVLIAEVALLDYEQPVCSEVVLNVVVLVVADLPLPCSLSLGQSFS